VCVCQKPECLLKPSSTFSTCFIVSGKCISNGTTTLTCQHRESCPSVCVRPSVSVRVCPSVCVRPSVRPNSECLHLLEILLLRIQTHSVVTHHYSGAVTFLTEGNVPISLHVFLFVLIVQQDIVLIHDALFFFLHVCVFCINTGAFPR